METIKEKGVDTLKELIIINNDRHESYKIAACEINEANLKVLFTEFSLQSKRFSNELRKLIPSNEEAPANDETKIFGDFYRSWMDMKNALMENDNKAILSSCESWEDIVKKTYDDVIMNPDISDMVLTFIKKQKSELDKSYEIVKAIRNLEFSVK